MAFIPVPDIAMATIEYLSNDGVIAINRLYCGNTDPQTVESLEEITDALYDVWAAQIMPLTSDSWQLNGIRARSMAEEEGLQFVDENTYPVAGGVSDSPAQGSQVSYTVTLQTGLVGRSARGRVYGVGLPTAAQNGVRLTDAARSARQSAWTLVRTAMETAGHAINVVSFFEDGVARTEGRPLPIVSTNVRFPLATQRRRLS